MLRFVCCDIDCFSAGDNEAEIRHQIESAAVSMKTMQCDFVQTKYLRMLNDKMVSTGKMYYQQSDKLRWEYTSPYTYAFVLNGFKGSYQ